MIYYHVNYFKNKNKKGQIKIQQMAFVLVALMIFFALVSLFYFSVRYSALKTDVETLREQEVREVVRKMAGTPEFAWTIYDCDACIDLDKIIALKDRTTYEGFWRNIPLLQIVRVYPTYPGERECTREIYPNCNTITIVDENKDLVAHSAFVALCRYESEIDFTKCELGKIVMGFETLE